MSPIESSNSRMQELYLKLSFTLLNSHSPNDMLPDIIGTVARAQSSNHAATAMKEIADIGEFVCNSGAAQSFEQGLLKYATSVTELDVQFLEQIRAEICKGMEAFESLAVMKMTPVMEKQVSSNQTNLTRRLFTRSLGCLCPS